MLDGNRGRQACFQIFIDDDGKLNLSQTFFHVNMVKVGQVAGPVTTGGSAEYTVQRRPAAEQGNPAV